MLPPSLNWMLSVHHNRGRPCSTCSYWSFTAFRSIPPDRLKQITDLLESDIMIRYVSVMRLGYRSTERTMFETAHLSTLRFVGQFTMWKPQTWVGIVITNSHQVVPYYSPTGADTVRFKAEVNFDGREVARAHVDRLNLENLLVVWVALALYSSHLISTLASWTSPLPSKALGLQWRVWEGGGCSAPPWGSKARMLIKQWFTAI